VSLVTDEEMEGWKRDYPEAFGRKIDYAAGVCTEGWMHRGRIGAKGGANSEGACYRRRKIRRGL
jgi:hypothetical protein